MRHNVNLQKLQYQLQLQYLPITLSWCKPQRDDSKVIQSVQWG